MRIDVEVLQLPLGESLFLSGKNFGNKIKVGDKGIKELYYVEGTGFVHVVCDGQIARVKGYMSFTEKRLTSAKALEILDKAIPEVYAKIQAQATGPERTIRTAQVSNPTQEVQNPPKGKRAKYQGQESV